jgi:hypothetical protein
VAAAVDFPGRASNEQFLHAFDSEFLTAVTFCM